MSKTQIPTQPGMGRSIIDHDPQNRNYPVRGVLFQEGAELKEKVWRRGHAYDQGQTSMCVAFSGKGMLNTAPFSKWQDYDVRSDYSFAEFYNGAQANDEWPGENYDGTSARGLLIYLTSVGIVKEYRWCFGLDDVLQTLSHHGPVSVGSWWTNPMFDPDPNTYLVSYTGEKIGGHQWELFGIHPDEEEVEAMNSWGVGWGDRGRFRMKFDELGKLLDDAADAHTLIL